MEHAKTGRPFISIGELLVECIPVEPKLRICEEGAIIKTASGSCGIVACAYARLGGNAAFFGKVGRDGLSDFVYGALKREGVDVSHIVVSDEGRSVFPLSNILKTAAIFNITAKILSAAACRQQILTKRSLRARQPSTMPGCSLRSAPKCAPPVRNACVSRANTACLFHSIRTSARRSWAATRPATVC